MTKARNIEGWPFPVYGPLSVQSKHIVGGPVNTKKVVASIQTLQKQKLKQFDSSTDALFKAMFGK